MTTEWTDLPTLQDVAKAQADGWEIELHIEGHWYLWDGSYWKSQFKFRARPRQPAINKVKMLCFHNGSGLVWWDERNTQFGQGWIRIPAQDIEIEIPEGV